MNFHNVLNEGFTFDDGNSFRGLTSPVGQMQNYVGSGKGQKFQYEPEKESFLAFGKYFKTHFFNAQGAGSTTFGLRNFDGTRNGFFRVEKDTAIAGAGTPIFEADENQNITFYRDTLNNQESKVTIQGTIESTGGTFTGAVTVDTGQTFTTPRLPTVSVSASTTLTEATHAGRYLICAWNVTLPATSSAGEHYTILNTTGGNITVGRNGNNINN